ncbi:hypothetical protein [Larkinella soli]|uniref:hypothetical protein n=1 Tax=Larkinella soli TaxID=1770527 RepID=UPI000FFBEF2B|nr:hypothetical protein [Larkinella soli]
MNSLLWMLPAVPAGLYAAALLRILLKVRKKCECPECRNAIHLERTYRPGWMKRYFGYLPLKYFHCRSCHYTFYLHRDTPDTEPVRAEKYS